MKEGAGDSVFRDKGDERARNAEKLFLVNERQYLSEVVYEAVDILLASDERFVLRVIVQALEVPGNVLQNGLLYVERHSSL